MRRLVVGLLAVAIAVACSDPGPTPPPPPVPSSDLHFVRLDTTAPQLLADSVAFYAKLGEDREVRMFFRGATPSDTGDKYLAFKVPAQSLLRRPNGTPFQPGDSIQISIKVLDRHKFLLDFEPAGLVFNPLEPARLELDYNHADHDFDGDGVITAADSTIKTELGIWQRTPPDTLWTKLTTLNLEELEELEGKIPHFTDHALAW
jgi:hypothetical protein